MREDCRAEMEACETDATCNREVTEMLAAWATGDRPRPGSDLFNDLALCSMTKGDGVCDAEMRACFFDEACNGEINSDRMPQPVNTAVEDVMRCFFTNQEGEHVDPCG